MSAPSIRPRLDYLDLVRGLVIVLMALDHTRDFFLSGGGAFGAPENVAAASPALFFTRWITHFCAPTFVFLAGVGSFLSIARGQDKGSLAKFLVIRGFWLILLEFTIVKFGWSLSFKLDFVMWQVIWTIGWSMIALAAFVRLPPLAVALLGLIIICGHNLLDGITARDLGRFGWLWDGLHTVRPFAPLANPWPDWLNEHVPLAMQKTLKRISCFNLYPVLPWFGVMCLGFGMGPLFVDPARQKRDRIFTLGIWITMAFVALRFMNGYGNPVPWKEMPDWYRAMMSFLNCTKYPPSLDFLLMTLGPALIMLGLVTNEPGNLGKFFVVFGRVPLFFYVIHLPAIHGLSELCKQIWGTPGKDFWGNPTMQWKGFDLLGTYAVWIIVVLALFPLCWWYGKLKAKYGGILRYL